MKLEIEVKYNIGDRVYYVNFDSTIQVGEITHIRFSGSNREYMVYTVDNLYEFVEDELFLSIKECEESLPDFIYNREDQVFFIEQDMICKGKVIARDFRNGEKLYTAFTSNGKYFSNVEESNIFSTLEEAVKHFDK